jgi:hypothetical protein
MFRNMLLGWLCLFQGGLVRGDHGCMGSLSHCEFGFDFPTCLMGQVGTRPWGWGNVVRSPFGDNHEVVPMQHCVFFWHFPLKNNLVLSQGWLCVIWTQPSRNGWLHKQIAQPHPTNCGLAWQCCFLPLHSKGRCFLDLSHSKCNFRVVKSIEICDIYIPSMTFMKSLDMWYNMSSYLTRNST